MIDHYVPELRRRDRAASCASRATGRARQACRMSTTSKASATWCVPQHGHIRPGHVLRRRRLALAHRRRVRRLHVRHRRDRDARRAWSPARSGCRCPQTILMEWDGTLADGVTAKDMMLSMHRPLRHGRRRVPGGRVLRRRRAALSMQERMTLANMSAELGGQAGPDRARRDHARLAGTRTARRSRHRAVAQRRRRAAAPDHRFDAATLAPQVAAPHSPANARAVRRTSPARRSTSPTSAPAPAPSSTTCAPRRRFCAGRGSRTACA